PETCAMALAVPGRPVKVEYLREEDWVASVSRHPGKYWMKIGFKKDGTPVACDARFTGYKGAYYVDASGVGFTTGAWLIGTYKWGTIRYKGEMYFTNQVPSGAFRGYGNPQTQFVMEQLVDRACNALGIDPLAWRLKFHKGVGDDGWILGFKYPSCALDECLKRGAEAIGWEEKRKKYQNQTGTKRRGVGIGVMTHTSGAFPMLLEHTTCTVKLNEDATAEVILSCSDLGQGIHSALRSIAAETLGIPVEDVHMKVADSDASGFDIGAHASRTTYVGGGATLAAAEDAKKQILQRASEMLEASPEDLELKDKKVFVKGSPDKSVDLKEITQRAVYATMDHKTGQPLVPQGQIQGYASYRPVHHSPPWSASFAEVEVDTETGKVKVVDFVTAYDIGRAIHPANVEGQLEGGAQQGLGNVLTEDIDYNAKGLCRNNSFTDYKLLGPVDMPPMKIILVEDPDPMGPYGAKGVGECGLITPIGAVANAIYHALGIQFKEEPITPERILKALKEKSKAV
ncbi:MAG TPA: molybdopterin-dependent oxidoreductase, partial [Thermodesulfobacteriota bacterium]|nr:molybdopterin-dependent oxidoreductase [Thermodesulfobacteriota bacterium]